MAKGKKMSGADMGFSNDGDSKNTFAPSVKSTPNEVGAEESISRKNGKGDITGGIEDKSIFGDIEYTGNTIQAAKKDYNSVDKSIFEKPNYSYTKEGFAGGDNDGVFGSDKFAAKAKDRKVNGNIEKDEASRERNEGENPQGKRKLKVDSTFNGKNPTSLNVKRK
jgi:hypothetical protein